ncbi:hypothetical protein OO013_16560 [Mangrovivirga sp. M17]|uniref:PH domain-containing protein n=1 Tax=Mangrovivirga halotolerans TaxID=2993936 RepID=A0ABT3RVV7_9BACT|nr:hypothetical protein [Mangrovivirga halotolerans]MCX2745494.1 hypothetical protein [Mangrovivirga halotolerans]
MKEYKIAKGWAIFIYLFSPVLLGLFGWVLSLPFQEENFSPNASWIIIPVSIAMIVLIIYGLAETYKGKLLIQNDRIIYISTFYKRILTIDEVKGYTVNEQYIFVEPKSKNKKRIKISKYTGGYGEILFWFSLRFPDLDKVNTFEEEQDILSNETYGESLEIREDRLQKARKTSRVINWLAGLSSFWIIFYPTPYQFAILAGILIPITGLIAVKLSNGLIHIDEKKGSAYPSVIYSFIFPPLGIMLRAILDFNIFDFSNVWLPTFLITVIFLILLLNKQKQITIKDKTNFITIACLTLFLFAYSIGVVIQYNCYYDNSQAKIYTAKILNKRISSGRSTTHYLELSSWGPQKEIEEISVDKKLYSKVNIGEQVTVNFKKGNLNIPWLVVTND